MQISRGYYHSACIVPHAKPCYTNPMTTTSATIRGWARIQRLRNFALTDGQHLGYRDAARRDVLALRQVNLQDPPVPRRARGFAAGLLAHIDVLIGDDVLLAGAFAPAPPPDAQARWEAERQALQAQLAVPGMAFTPELVPELTALHQSAGPNPWFGNVGQGHSNINFVRVLECGLEAMAADADAAQTMWAERDPERAATLTAMATVLRGVIAFAERHADAAEAQAATSTPERAAELRRISASCRRAPGQPAESFFDAVQAVWLVYLALGMSESPSANSLGCVDRYLYPYFARDLAAGRITLDEAEELTAHFLLKCGCYAEGQSLTLGGQNADGTDAVNDLTRLFFRVIPRLGLPEPIISVRIHDGMRADDLDAVVAITAAGHGNPSYYYEPRCRAMLATRNVAVKDRDRLAINPAWASSSPAPR